MSRDRVLTAIDVGSSKIAVVICSLIKDKSPSVIGVSSVESLGVKKGQIVDIEAAVQSIAKGVELAEKMAGVSVSTATISVGGAHIASINSKGVVAVAQPEGEITPLDVKRVIEAAKAVSLPSAREIIHVLPRDFTVDGQMGIKDPRGMTGIRLEVETQIVTGSSTAIHNLVKCVSQVGIDVDSIAYSGLVSAQSVLTETEKELGVILVDIGAGTTDLAIFIEGALSYSTVLPVGARNVTNDLAVGLRVSLESAEKIKLFLSAGAKVKTMAQPEEVLMERSRQPVKSTDELDVTSLDLSEEIKKVSKKTLIEGIIRPRLSEIFTLVGLEIQKSGFVGMTPAGIVVTGGGAETIGILDSARQKLGMPSRIGTPSGLTGLVDELRSPQFATVVGLTKFASTNEESNVQIESNFSPLSGVSSFGKMAQKLPLGSLTKKLTSLLKSFLP